MPYFLDHGIKNFDGLPVETVQGAQLGPESAIRFDLARTDGAVQSKQDASPGFICTECGKTGIQDDPSPQDLEPFEQAFLWQDDCTPKETSCLLAQLVRHLRAW